MCGTDSLGTELARPSQPPVHPVVMPGSKKGCYFVPQRDAPLG